MTDQKKVTLHNLNGLTPQSLNSLLNALERTTELEDVSLEAVTDIPNDEKLNREGGAKGDQSSGSESSREMNPQVGEPRFISSLQRFRRYLLFLREEPVVLIINKAPARASRKRKR